MTRHSRIWAIGTLVLFLPFGAVVMAGVVPGAGSDHEALQDMAIIVNFLVEKHGAFLTGFFFMLIGSILAATLLVRGDYLRRDNGQSGDGLADFLDGNDGGD